MRLFLGALGILASLSITTPHAYGEVSDKVIAMKIDMAGRQRMLSQRIAKAACYISLFSDVDKHLGMLQFATNLFDKSLSQLKQGDQAQGLPAETNPAILEEISQVEKQWAILNFSSKLLQDFPIFPGSDIDLISEFNLPVLKQSNVIVQLMNSVYSKSDTTDERLITTVNIAGRQRMLTQKAAKEFCLISYGKDVAIHQQALKQTIAEFDQALADLKNGNTSRKVLPAPTADILERLIRMEGNWQRAREVMLDAANGKISRSADFRVVAFANEALLHQSNAVVKLLVDHSAKQ